MPNHFDKRDVKRLGVTRGAIVRRKADPVHVGRVTKLNHADFKLYAEVMWFALNCCEPRIPVEELELTEEWK